MNKILIAGLIAGLMQFYAGCSTSAPRIKKTKQTTVTATPATEEFHSCSAGSSKEDLLEQTGLNKEEFEKHYGTGDPTDIVYDPTSPFLPTSATR
jgi:hypothetical protein